MSVLLEAEKNAEPKVGTEPVLGDVGVVVPVEVVLALTATSNNATPLPAVSSRRSEKSAEGW